MEEKKPKDEEIIKALKFAIADEKNNDIGFWNEKYEWVGFSFKDVLDLINRLKDETQPKFGNWKVKFFKAQEEIERLTEENAERQKQVDGLKELAKIKLENEKNWCEIQTKQAVKDTKNSYTEKIKQAKCSMVVMIDEYKKVKEKETNDDLKNRWIGLICGLHKGLEIIKGVEVE